MTDKKIEKEVQEIQDFEESYQELLIKIGKNLNAHRTLAGLTLEETSQKINIQKDMLENVEKGRNIDYSLGLLLKLSMIYGIDLAQVF